MNRFGFEILFCGYSEEEVFRLAYDLGYELSNFLGENIFKPLLDSQILLSTPPPRGIEDYSYRIHPAAKALEGFLLKLIRERHLYMDKNYEIGRVFGEESQKVRKKIHDKKLIARTKSVWDFCRNDIMHFESTEKITIINVRRKYQEIIDLIKLLYKDFYTVSKPNEEIIQGYNKYIRSAKRNNSKYIINWNRIRSGIRNIFN